MSERKGASIIFPMDDYCQQSSIREGDSVSSFHTTDKYEENLRKEKNRFLSQQDFKGNIG